MKYAHIPYIDKPVSRIIFGTGGESFTKGGNFDDLLDGVLSLGVTTFDTARVYGRSEAVLGEWMERRNHREDVVLISKCAHPDILTWEKRVNHDAMWSDLRQSLSLLRTSYIDIYLLHRDNPEIPVGELVETFNEMYVIGKIRAFGGSNWTHERIEEANEYAYKHNLIPFSVSSPHFGLAEQVRDTWDPTCLSITGKEKEGARKWYGKNGMPVIAYASLCQGFFSGKLKYCEKEKAGEVLGEFAAQAYASEDNFDRLRRCEILAENMNAAVSQIALAWNLSQDMNVFSIVGSKSISRMQENVGAAEIQLTEEEAAYLNLEDDTGSKTI